MGSQHHFKAAPVIGEYVEYSWSYTDATTDRRGTGGGVYLGVALDEEDGNPMHYFIDGFVEGPEGRTEQGSHGFPHDDPTKAPTTDLTPTELIERHKSFKPFELVVLYREVQVADDGTRWWEEPIGDGFNTVEEATAAAQAHLAERTDDERYPWVGVIECELDEDGEHTGWARGWVTPDGVLHDGDYENDVELWADEEPIRVGKT